MFKPVIFSLQGKDIYPDSHKDFNLITCAHHDPIRVLFDTRMSQTRLLSSPVVDPFIIDDFQQWLVSKNFDLIQAARYLRSFSPYVTRQKFIIQAWCMISNSYAQYSKISSACAASMIQMSEYELFMVARMMVRPLTSNEIYTLCFNSDKYALGEPDVYVPKFQYIPEDDVDNEVYSWDDHSDDDESLYYDVEPIGSIEDSFAPSANFESIEGTNFKSSHIEFNSSTFPDFVHPSVDLELIEKVNSESHFIEVDSTIVPDIEPIEKAKSEDCDTQYISPPVIRSGEQRLYADILNTLDSPNVIFSCSMSDYPHRLCVEGVEILILSGQTVPTIHRDDYSEGVEQFSLIYTGTPIGELPQLDGDTAYINFSTVYSEVDALSWAAIDRYAQQNYTLWTAEIPYIPGIYTGPYLYREMKVFLRYSRFETVQEKCGNILIPQGLSASVTPFSNWFSFDDHIVFDSCSPPSEVTIMDVSTRECVTVSAVRFVPISTRNLVCVSCVDHVHQDLILDYMSRYHVDRKTCTSCGKLYIRQWTPYPFERRHFSTYDVPRVYSYDSSERDLACRLLMARAEAAQMEKNSKVAQRSKWKIKKRIDVPRPTEPEILAMLDYLRLSDLWTLNSYDGKYDGAVSFSTVDDILLMRVLALLNISEAEYDIAELQSNC